MVLASRYLPGLALLAPLALLSAERGGGRLAAADPVEALAAEGNEFAWEVYRRLAARPGNILFAPYGLRHGLAAIRSGARGQTARELTRALRMRLPLRVSQPAQAALREKLRADAADEDPLLPRLEIATAVWLRDGLKFREEFLSGLHSHYGASGRSADWIGDREGALREVRAFVEEATHGEIDDFDFDAGEPPLDPAALLLVNALYFRSRWALEFDEATTEAAPFHVSSTESADVPLMHQSESFGYLERASFQAVDIPYRGGRFSVVILLPKALDGLRRLEAEIRPGDLQEWLRGFRHRKVLLWVPRFEIASRLDLAATLRAMGIRAAFQPDWADFSSMAEGFPYLARVAQQSRIAVDEKGTEAAAVDDLEVVILYGEARPVVFRADHPFLFLIRHRETGTILFLGRLADPRG